MLIKTGLPIGNLKIRRRFTPDELYRIVRGDSIKEILKDATIGPNYQEWKQSLYETLFATEDK